MNTENFWRLAHWSALTLLMWLSLVDHKPRRNVLAWHIGANDPLGTYSMSDFNNPQSYLLTSLDQCASLQKLVWVQGLKTAKFKQKSNTKFSLIFPPLVLRSSGASWDPRPCLLLSAAPGCGSDGWHRLQSPRPPWLRGCPRRAGSRWPSSRPCRGQRGSRRRFCDNDRRRPLSPLWQRERYINKETTEIKALNSGTQKLTFVC